MRIEIVGVYAVAAPQSCHLIELEVFDHAGPIMFDGFKQQAGLVKDHWEVAWDGRVLNSTGTEDIAGRFPRSFDLNGDGRIVFYFHRLDFDMQLITPVGRISVPDASVYPRRLRFLEYIPPRSQFELFQIHVASGCIVVVDPLFITYAQNPRPNRMKPVLENDLFLSATGFDRLLAIQSIAMGQTKMDAQLDVIGYFDIAPAASGPYSFAIEAICRAEPNADQDPTKIFSVDTGQILVFDVEYLDGVLKHFVWKHAYKRNGDVDRKRERRHGQLIASRNDVYVQIQSPGVNRGVTFVGDGEYFFRDDAFEPVPP